MDSREYWRKREAENLAGNLKVEQEYIKELHSYYDNMMDQVQKEINGFYGKYARKEGISLSEAKRRVSKLDIEAYGRKAAKYVKEKDFSKEANEEMRLYNATMKINRLEMLKANIGLELVDGFDGLQKFFDEKLTERTLNEFERQAGILGKTVQNNAQAAHSIVNASFNNATYSDRIWMYQSMMKAELSKLLQTGLIQGRNPRQLATHLQKLFGARRSDAERLMRTELARVQIEAQKQSFERNGFKQYEFIALGSACDICKELDGKHFDVKKMMPGENAPPMHPNCRCSVAAYEDDAEYEEWLDFLDKGGTTKEWNRLKSASMASEADDIKWPARGKSISKEEYRELSAHAKRAGINIEGFKRFDGDIGEIKKMIDDANIIAERFPDIKSGRRKLTISLDEHMDSNDFAITNGHIIRINADVYRNTDVLSHEYDKLEKIGWFVKGTDYRSIIQHETGHVVANTYGIDGLEIAKQITGLKTNAELMIYLRNNLSIYSAEYLNGQEIISECFASVYSSEDNNFAWTFVEKCDKIVPRR